MESEESQHQILRVFGYGSLLWKPDFPHHKQTVGFIKGFNRRFYQGNTTYRGCQKVPGRVAILERADREEAAVTWGVTYEVRGKHHVQRAKDHLFKRETVNGGYSVFSTTFYPRPHRHPAYSDSDDSGSDSDNDNLPLTSKPFTVMTFTATPESELYMGPADLSTMAQQVVMAHGKAGSNAEYVLRTAEYIRRHIPEDHDSHLFDLEKEVRHLLASLHLKASDSLSKMALLPQEPGYSTLVL